MAQRVPVPRLTASATCVTGNIAAFVPDFTALARSFERGKPASFGMGAKRIRRARDALIAIGSLVRVRGRGVLRDPFQYRLIR
jgi:hypothetical protein